MDSNAPKRSSLRFASVSVKKAAGAHYTPSGLAGYVAEEIVNAIGDAPRKRFRALDPAVGDGELLLALAQQLPEEFQDGLTLVGFDTSQEAVESARARLAALGPRVTVSIEQLDFLDYVADRATPGLFAEPPPEPFDLLISNPPYVRTQILGARESRRLAARFGLEGRIDLYQAFLSAMAAVLRPGAIAGVIVSNRVLTTRSSTSLRTALLDRFYVEKVVDFGDTRLFGAAVLPAVLVLKRKPLTCAKRPSLFEAVYQAEPQATNQQATSPIDALRFQGLVRCENGKYLEVRRGRLETGDAQGTIWRLADAETDRWLQTVAEHTKLTFGQIGRVRVGVKTTADEVFISSEWLGTPPSERPELLRPLLTHHVAAPFRASQDPPPFEILYPHTKVGNRRVPVDINDYPLAAAYLERHRHRLEQRTYLREAGRRWYEIWVPQDPELWQQPKMVFPDIARSPAFFLDFSGALVNGDCYWIVPKSKDATELLWLAVAVANSPFIERFYDLMFNNKLYAGRRRFITQYVEHFPLPDPSTPTSQEIVSRSKQYFEAKDEGKHPQFRAEINQLVAGAFGLLPEEAIG